MPSQTLPFLLPSGTARQDVVAFASVGSFTPSFRFIPPHGQHVLNIYGKSEDGLVWRATKILHASAVSDRHDGWVLAEPAIIYRHHQHQTSQFSSLMFERIEFI